MTVFNPIEKTVLITGGCRSGKSQFAEALAVSVPGKRAYVATCPPMDAEMNVRIERHRAARADKGFVTIEQSLHLAETLSQLAHFDVVLVDCLTLWINNLIYEASGHNEIVDEDRIVAHAAAIKEVTQDHLTTTLFVTNEVGLGLVPPDPLSRLYRDLVGRCNQEVAKWVDHVVLMTAGIPQIIK